jgi:arylsulfatase A-like enzyme
MEREDEVRASEVIGERTAGPAKFCLVGMLTWAILSILLGTTEAIILLARHPYDVGFALVSWAIILYGLPGILGGAVWGTLSGFISRARRLAEGATNLVAFQMSSWLGVILFKITAPRCHRGPLLELGGVAFIAFTLLVILPLFLLASIISYKVLKAVLKARIPRFFTTRRGVLTIATSIILLFITSRFSAELKSALFGAKFFLNAPSGGESAALAQKPNVILIVMDTVRKDRLSCYGYGRDTTPHIDQLARSGVLFRNAYSSSCWTPPAHSSLFTGNFPSKTGVLNLVRTMPRSNLTLAEILKGEHYITLGVVANSMISAAFGYGQGFQAYDELYDVEAGYKNAAFFLRNSLLYGWLQNEPRAKPIVRLLTALIIRQKTAALFVGEDFSGDRVNERVFYWLDTIPRDRPFFLFINYLDAHSPYEPPDSLLDRATADYNGWIKGKKGYELMNAIHGVEEELWKGSPGAMTDAQYLSGLYDGEISYLDRKIWELVEGLKDRGIMDNTILFITSDHGEQFGEHGLMEHRNSLYQELISVPLILYSPSLYPPRTIDGMVSLCDIPVTILDILRIPAPGSVQGKSLLPLLNGKTEEGPRPIVTEWKDSKALIQGDWKYIRSAGRKKEELYNIVDDPHEEVNMIAREPEIARGLDGSLQAWIDSFKPLVAANEGKKMNETLRERLKALGYLD